LDFFITQLFLICYSISVSQLNLYIQCYKTKGERRWLLKSMQYDETAPQSNKEQAAAEGDYEVFIGLIVYGLVRFTIEPTDYVLQRTLTKSYHSSLYQ
jgi:hypothetical protein